MLLEHSERLFLAHRSDLGSGQSAVLNEHEHQLRRQALSLLLRLAPVGLAVSALAGPEGGLVDVELVTRMCDQRSGP